MSRPDKFVSRVPPGGAIASNGLVLTKQMVTQAISRKAKSGGFSAGTVRSTTVLYKEAIDEFADKRRRKLVAVQDMSPGELVEYTIERLQDRVAALEAANKDLISRNALLRSRLDLPLRELCHLAGRITVLDRLDRFEAVYAAFDEAGMDVHLALNNIASGAATDPVEAAKWAMTRMEKLVGAMLQVRPSPTQ